MCVAKQQLDAYERATGYPYSLQDNVQHLLQLQQRGQRLGLLLGRRPAQGRTPAELGANVYWAFACADMAGVTTPDGEHNAVHFLLDVTDADSLAALPADMFTALVMDAGVLQHFEPTDSGHEVFCQYLRLLAPGGVLSFDQVNVVRYTTTAGPTSWVRADPQHVYHRCLQGEVNMQDQTEPGLQLHLHHLALVAGVPGTMQEQIAAAKAAAQWDDDGDLTWLDCCEWPLDVYPVHIMAARHLAAGDDDLQAHLLHICMMYEQNKRPSRSDILRADAWHDAMAHTCSELHRVGFTHVHTRTSRPYGNECTGRFYFATKARV